MHRRFKPNRDWVLLTNLDMSSFRCVAALFGDVSFYSQMFDLQIFQNSEFGVVRTVQGEDGEPKFCLSDVCSSLGLNSTKVAQRLTDDVLSKYPISDSMGRMQETNFVNEDGLYDVILDSRKKKAKMFRKWVTSEVLPSIRKNGGYMATTENDTPELIMARAFMLAKETIENHERKIKELEVIKKNQSRQIETMQPKADFYDTIMGTDKAVEMKDVAKILDMGIGRNNLFKFLKEHKVLDKNNCPYQLYVDKRWFKSIPVYFDDPYTGKPSIYLKTAVYPAGIDGIRQMLRQKGYKKNVAQDHDYITSEYR